MLGSAANAEDVDTTNNTVIAMADCPMLLLVVPLYEKCSIAACS